MILRLLAGALLCVLFVSNAEARPRHRQPSTEMSFFGLFEDPQTVSLHPAHRHRTAHRTRRRVPEGLRRVLAEGAGRVVGGRPAGCPRRYCGCGASLYLFGKIIPSLNLAANWLRFPRALPAPGMAAAKRGHVFVLKRHIAGKTWLVFDANSGRGKTRVHLRSIAGFKIVNPRGSRLAMQ